MANETEAKPNWTVMVYMVADTGDSFYRAAMENIAQMTEGKFDDRIKVVVHADAPPPWDTKCWEVTGITNSKKGEARGVGCQHNRKCLLSFVEHCMNAYKSDRYLLVLWGHGEGIRWKEKVLGDSQGAGKGFVPGSEGALEAGELGKALGELRLPKGTKKENVVVGFDACLMAMVEVYSEISPYVGWAVAANDEIPDTGWPYTEILNKLGEDPGAMSPEELARAIVVECKTYYSKDELSVEDIVSFSASDLSEQKRAVLVETVRELTKQLNNHLSQPSGLDAIKKAREFAVDFREKAYVDLHAFCAHLLQKAELEENAAALRKLGSAAGATNKALEAFVTKHQFSDAYPYMYWDDARAVSICFPESPDLEGTLPGQQIDWGSYKDLRFSKDTRWYTFVDQFLKVQATPRSPVD